MLCDEDFKMNSAKEDVYATVLNQPYYSFSSTHFSFKTGALVLAHSLRDGGTKKKLAVLVTPEKVSTYALKELREIFDYVIPVERIENEFPANLQLMNRPDLHSTFTKILLWKQYQFRKLVYLDSDMVALRAPDELFDLPYPFSAAPDIGWPDIFNSGLMVLSPNENDYNALLSMAQRGASFDGADQGLLNMHFTNNFNRLSFTYNVSPSAHYQYAPAYQYFRSKIVMHHFIGQNKPWLQGRCRNSGSIPVDEMSNLWWSIYDRHYKTISKTGECLDSEIDKILRVQEKIQFISEDISSPFQANDKIESETKSGVIKSMLSIKQMADHSLDRSVNQSATQTTIQTATQSADQTTATQTATQLDTQSADQSATQSATQSANQSATQVDNQWTEQPHKTFDDVIYKNQLTNHSDGNCWRKNEFSAWDASKEPPPADSRPEASNLPKTQYTMSSDPTLFKAPDRYPDPPSDMWYEVPKAPTYQKLSPIFPWEINAHKPSRIFAKDNEDLLNFQVKPGENKNSGEESKNNESITGTTTAASSKPLGGCNWESLSRANAWDDVPEINQYVGKLQCQSHRKIFGVRKEIDVSLRAESSNFSNFSTNSERQVLPVTPAPLRSSNFWSNDKYISQSSTAQSVPSQEEWDPKAALEHLAYHQLKVMTQDFEKASDPAPDIL
ncbi:hypothetical protein EPUL_004145 [Erysiphe pulchra]|uniref:glycogenin glucosyltransferase n=1 Tax=Erysiphe pulchra TaxID=225359 RepID=A0A2S4PVH3_9PEZI|nr:hypothetical protein EPUL_004145 [Erysiphe pulchra]